MNRFLRETWELWYWAMFCPSKLQQRMNEWSLQPEENGSRNDTAFSDLLFSDLNPHFFFQYLLILIILNLPLIWKIYSEDRAIDAWLILIVFTTSYGVTFWFSSLGLIFPILFSIVYWQQPEVWFDRFSTNLASLQDLNLPLLTNQGKDFVIFTLTWIPTLILARWLLAKNNLFWGKNVVIIGGTLSALSGSWWATQNVGFVLLVSGLAGCFLFVNRDKIAAGNLQKYTGKIAVDLAVGVARGVAFGMVFGMVVAVAGSVAFGVDKGMMIGVAGGLAFGVAIGVAGGLAVGVTVGMTTGVFIGIAASVIGSIIGAIVVGVAGGVAGSVAGGVATLALPLFLLASWLSAWSLSPLQRFGLTTAGILTLLGINNLGWHCLWAIPVSLAGYYRLFPGYLFCGLTLLFSIPFTHRYQTSAFKWLSLLPPHTSELLWLPLPNHDKILAAAFRIDSTEALKTFEKMQTLPFPGFKPTLKRALPQIIADRLSTPNTTAELITTITLADSILPSLIPSFDFSEPENTPASPWLTAEISTMLKQFQAVARDVEATLESRSSALRERGLERILNNLYQLQVKLPQLGLNPQQISRWQPAIQRWRNLLELELKEQQKQSQGELLNPFQFGNPLTLKRTEIFKGRQTFADNIVRLILDRNRPTLVLHAPRRCGKTSFLLNLPRLLPSDLLPVYLDLQSAAATTDEAAFWYALVRTIHKDSRSQGVTLPATPSRQEFRDSPYTALDDWLETALPRLEHRRLLLNLDEFEKIGEAIQAGRLSLQLFDQLRHLIQHYDGLAFLFSGVQTLDELGPNWSSYFISVVPIEMLYLEPHEAEDLLVNPDPEFELRYDRGIIERVLHLTRCQPYLVQLLGSAMVTQANLHHTKLITPELLENAIADSFIQGEPYFTNVWDEFTGTTDEERVEGRDYLRALARGERPSGGGLARIRMLRYHVIETTDKGDRIEVPLLEMWVRKR